MTEPQVWTMIGVMAVVFFGTMTLISTMFTRVVRSEIGGLRGEMNAQFNAVDARFNAVDARFDTVDVRFEAVNARFDAMSDRIDNLDRDVHTLTEREMNRDN